MYQRDGRSWQVGAATTVSWINALTTIGSGIDAGVPPVYPAYATLELPDEDQEALDDALVGLLANHTPGPWWLGYLRTGDALDDIAPELPPVTLYANWSYTLIRAGAEQAATWRSTQSTRGKLPDLIYPQDRSWLVTHLWDDQWRCLGGPTDLINTVLAAFPLAARPVTLRQDATPPGRHSI